MAQHTMEVKIIIRKSRRKTIGLQIREPGVLLVKAPLFLSEKEIMEEVYRHEVWISNQMNRALARQEEERKVIPFTEGELQDLKRKASVAIPLLVREYADLMELSYGRISIRAQKTRWGSCSSKGNLNFNCLLMLTPEPVRRYVVIHELCHLREMNHSRKFWSLVEDMMPDYRVYRKWLKQEGGTLIRRLP